MRLCLKISALVARHFVQIENFFKMANVTTSLCEFHDLYGIESQDLGKDTTEKNTYSAY